MRLFLVILVLVTALFSKVDLNNASEEEMRALKGVGVKKAEKILEYRKSVKCFKSIDELTNVKGVGKATLRKNRANLVLGKCHK